MKRRSEDMAQRPFNLTPEKYVNSFDLVMNEQTKRPLFGVTGRPNAAR